MQTFQTKAPGLDRLALHAALDKQRQDRCMTWKMVAEQTHVSASTLSRLQRGQSPDVDGFARLVAWLGGGSDHFLRQPTRSGCDNCLRLQDKIDASIKLLRR